MLKKKLAFIGAGNMAQALINALINEGFDPNNIIVSNPSLEKLHALKDSTQVHITQNNLTAAEEADIIILCVKPQKLREVCEELKAIIIRKNLLVISIAAGASIEFFSSLFQQKTPIIRSMPNISALVGAGATALCHNIETTHEHREMAEIIFRSVGIIAWVEEKDMDAITAVFGSGPAYIFLIMEILQKNAEDFGISTENAKLFTLQTIFGAAKLAFESEKSFSQLRESVTSPKGTTEAALAILEENHIAEIFEKALNAAKSRAKALASEE